MSGPLRRCPEPPRRAQIGRAAEHLAIKGLRRTLVAISVKSHNLLTADGHRVQVKARTVEPVTRASAVFSVFRSVEFNIAVLITFDSVTYALRQAVRSRGPNSKSLAGTPRTSTDA